MVDRRVRVVTHYCERDPECIGDYDGIEIFVDNQLVKTYGDYYHDKGSEKAEGFVEGLSWLEERYGARAQVEHVKKADRQCVGCHGGWADDLEDDD